MDSIFKPVPCPLSAMFFSQTLLALPVLGLLVLNVLAVPHSVKLPRDRPDNHTLNRERADAVKAAFVFSWDGYKKYAFPHDELHPVSNGFSDSRYAKALLEEPRSNKLVEMLGEQVQWMHLPQLLSCKFQTS